MMSILIKGLFYCTLYYDKVLSCLQYSLISEYSGGITLFIKQECLFDLGTINHILYVTKNQDCHWDRVECV